MDKYLSLALALYLFVNLVTFVIFYFDKVQQRRHRFYHGIPSHTLLTLAVLGGALGELLGMLIFRHKWHHKEFRILLPIIFVVQVIIAIIIIRMYLTKDVDPSTMPMAWTGIIHNLFTLQS